MKTTWLYGNHRNLGWGAIEISNDETFEVLDFEPEFETKRDVKNYIKQRYHLLNILKPYIKG